VSNDPDACSSYTLSCLSSSPLWQNRPK
jgi:hypothetical protein